MFSIQTKIRQWVQKVLFWWVKVPENPHHTDFDPILKAKHCVYVLEHQSTADALVVDHQLKKLGLPGLHEKLQLSPENQEKALLTVHPRKSVLQRHQPSITPRIQSFIDHLAVNSDEEILLVPIALYWGRTASTNNSIISALLSSNWSVVGRFRKLLTVLLNGRDTYLEINAPISLRQLIDESEDHSKLTRKVARVLRVHFRHVRTAVIGPDLSHKRVIIDQILSSEPVRKAIATHSSTKSVSLDKSRAVARKHALTIAANVSYNTIRVLDVLLTRLWNKIYNGIVLNGIEPVRELAKDNEIVYVPCHRSHIDYLLLSYSLHRNGLNVPHIAAGENLNMPIVGNILRRGGAFFIRRKFGGDKLYSTVFNEYIHTVFRRGYPVEYFVEGGRSRTGRMRNPATGTLAMTVKSHLRDSSRPIVFIPVYIGYEKVFESGSYLGELKGKTKKKENLFDLVKTVKHLKNYGHVYLNFGEPIKLNDELNEQVPTWRDTPYGPNDKPDWMFQFVDSLSTKVVTKINAAAALNPINLIATVLLSTPKQAIESTFLEQQLSLLIELNKEREDLVTLPTGTPKEWIEYAVKMNTLRLIPQKFGDIYGLDSHNTVLMSYYRNNVQHLFALPSLVAALVARSEGIEEAEMLSLITLIHPYIRSELFIDGDDEETEKQALRIIKDLLKLQLICQNSDGLYCPPEASSDKHLQLQYLANIILPTLERYLLTLSVLVRFGNGECSQTVLENQSQQMAQRLSLLNGLDAPEFFDKALFKNFIMTLKKRGALKTNEEGKLTYSDNIPMVISKAGSVMPNDIWYNVLQVTKRSTS
ncbi:glycerol-3-phosphate 1-O-acyltransferase PlsB [Reinekea marina]|uniref:Glycerol-3-phosphate acyltransferase n=1 Tax=Reinekea marina TaxID=1310421 RepID=A0ABV7WPF7_9GAMM|nr:glycerol-3-phosphate 1-O-acyltransferase PlsB [Reinekea marina]MDN3649907.1 glycerol-3-phosphate 1-O-acyltransferase PlsB [Reinekea marina]